MGKLFDEDDVKNMLRELIRGIDAGYYGDEFNAEDIEFIIKEELEDLSPAQPDAPDANVGNLISRQAAVELAMKYCPDDDGAVQCDGDIRELLDELENLPPAQPEPSEITDGQAILHLQSTGWMQNHDREMYESGLREQLADDSGGYDSLIPCEDTISRQAAIEALAKQMPTPYTPDGSHPADEGIFQVQEVYADCIETLELLPPAQPEERTKKRTETHECD